MVDTSTSKLAKPLGSDAVHEMVYGVVVKSVSPPFGCWTATTGAVEVAKREYRRRFGEPVPALVTTPVVAIDVSAVATAAGVLAGFASRYNAAAPATCGEAIDVPDIVAVAVSDE